MRINYNVSAMLANNTLANNDNLLAKSIEKLSSGLKINHAKDNPAGLAMAKRMNAQITGIGVASQNASDGISVIETADGALTEVQSMLGRMTELATQAANGTLTDDDRQVIQSEVAQLKSEIARISQSTEYNGQPLLDGSFDLKAYTTNPTAVQVSTYTPDVETGIYKINAITWSVDAEGKQHANVEIDYAAGGTKNPATGKAYAEYPGVESDYSTTMEGNIVTLKGPNGFEMKLEVNENLVFAADGTVKAGGIGGFDIDATGIGSMRLQVGANEGQVLDMAIPAISLKNMGIAEMDVSTENGARKAMDMLSEATAFVNRVRGTLGAYQNRLESTSNSLNVTNENMTSAYSRIMDVDMAEEMTNYSTYTVLTQAGTSVLAQANERPSQVLQLLQ